MLNEEQQELAHRNEYNFDHPDAFDFDLLIETLRKLKDGKRVEVPIYNFVTHAREKLTVNDAPLNIIIHTQLFFPTENYVRCQRNHL